MRRVIPIILVLVIVGGFLIVQLSRGVPSVTAEAVSVTHPSTGKATSITWPVAGEAAFGVQGTGVLAEHGNGTPVPIASVTKVMTAYVVLHDHPIGATGNGATIPVPSTAVTIYNQDVAAGDSVVAVAAGEHLTEMQALEALLLPSGDNVAEILAVWDAGSETAFVTKMNAQAKTMGLTNTHYADSSGVNTASTSTAADQTTLAMAAMTIAAFRSVVGMSQATIPVAGVQYNIDAILGKDGIVGVKTGYTSAAGGCFVFDAPAQINGTTVNVVGAVLGQGLSLSEPSALEAAFTASTALLTTAEANLVHVTVLKAGTPMGRLHAPWASAVTLDSAHSVDLVGLAGSQIATHVELPGRIAAPVAAHRQLGTVVVHFGTQTVDVPLVTSGSLPAVSLSWRLTNF